jgi:competence protein ComGC
VSTVSSSPRADTARRFTLVSGMHAALIISIGLLLVISVLSVTALEGG